ADSFVIPRLPVRYDAWGIRQGWKGPVLLRAAADLKLPPGKQRFMLRARGLSRLWVNGNVVARTKQPTGNTGGYQPVQAVAEPPLKGMRPVPFGDQEDFGEAEVGSDGICRVVLETLVGGKNFRAETGELSLSLLSSDGASYLFVQPDNSMASEVVTDLGWKMSSARSEASLVELDDHNRRTAATAQDQYWAKRHQTARDWVRSNPPPSVPGSTGNPLDAFLDARIQAALAASAGGMSPEGKLFHEKVLPVLRDNCFRCHGEKDKGGLRLNSREDALRPAKSGKLAIVPGKAAESEIISRLTTTDL